MTTVRGVSSPPRVTPKPVHDFSHFSPTRIQSLRDGGTITLDGNLNRSVSAEVRMDGSLSSPTRGKFFVATKMFMGKAEAERPMTKTELKELRSSLKTFLSSVRLDQATGARYSQFTEKLDAAIGTRPTSDKVTAATQKKLLKSTTEALKKNVKWLNSMPLGARYVRVPLFSEKHPDGFSYTALVQVGALTPTAKVGDPNKATSFMIERSGGIAGQVKYAGPISLP